MSTEVTSSNLKKGTDQINQVVYMMLNSRKTFVSTKQALLSLIPLLPLLALLVLLIWGQTASSESPVPKIETLDSVLKTKGDVFTEEEQAPIHTEASEQVSPEAEEDQSEVIQSEEDTDEDEEEEDC